MFDLLKLIQKKDEFQMALAGVSGNFQDSHDMSFGCDSCNSSCTGGCFGSCQGECFDSCYGTSTSGL